MTIRRSLPRVWATTAALFAIAVLTLSACTASGGTDFSYTSATAIGTVIPVADRKPAQDISGDPLDGGDTLRLAADRGKVTVVNFWASWCHPCQTETPALDALYRQVRADGVDFLGIDTSDERGSAQTFVAQNHISYPMIFDQPGRIKLQLGNIPAFLPITVLVDKLGRVAAVYVEQFTTKDLQKAIDVLRAEPNS